jgi:hypothetical protein
LGAVHGRFIKITRHAQLGVALEQRDGCVDLGAKLLLHFDLQLLEGNDEGVEMHRDTMIGA